MIAPEAWQAFGGVAAVVILLGSLALALQRLGLLRIGAAPVARDTDDAALRERINQAERDVAALRLHLAEHYVRRDDWVQMTSRVIGMLEDHSVMLARLDERFGAAERIWNGDHE